MVDVFISYARANQDVVRRLAEAVRREGYGVWWDEELPPHLSYGDVIAEKIGAAKAAIVVWSRDSAASEWVRAEADVARNQKKLIQTSIDDRMPPMPFNQIQFAQIGDWRGEDDHPGWIKVKASLRALCGGDARDSAAPAPPRAPPPLPPPPPRSQLVPVLIGLLLVAVLAVGYLLWLPGGDETDQDVAGAAAPPAANQAAPAPPLERPRPAPKAAAREPAPREARPPARRADPAAAPKPIAVRRYCMGPGRGTPECRRLRRRLEQR